VTNEAQLQWEARWARPAAFAAFAAGLAFLAQVVMFQAVLDDRRRFEPLPDYLLSVDERPALFVGSATVQALGALLLVPVFLYLFRATVAREAAIPRWFVYLIYAGPVIFALARVLASIDQVDLAHDFADGTPIEGQRGVDRADRLVEDNPNALAFGLGFAGSIAVAFLFVMIPLRARRAGLLSPFLGILGVIVGALLVLQLVPLVPTIIQAFWLGAIGALYLGNWPGGRGPAWETGRAEPWPSAADRRRVTSSEAPPAEAPEPETASVGDDADAAHERRASRKRKRKRG
jgi:MFS family permease